VGGRCCWCGLRGGLSQVCNCKLAQGLLLCCACLDLRTPALCFTSSSALQAVDQAAAANQLLLPGTPAAEDRPAPPLQREPTHPQAVAQDGGGDHLVLGHLRDQLVIGGLGEEGRAGASASLLDPQRCSHVLQGAPPQ